MVTNTDTDTPTSSSSPLPFSYRHNYEEYDIDTDTDMDEYCELLDKCRNNPDQFGLHRDELLTWQKAGQRTEFRRSVIWWERIENGS
ncbi:MAG: hypothetical protein WC110_08635 [Bacteroidales bacterium]|jgi:hypothetical protein|nr:hypothetical protein [Dehalococcoidia bacterium]